MALVAGQHPAKVECARPPSLPPVDPTSDLRNGDKILVYFAEDKSEVEFQIPDATVR
jgi:hypothetical protein